MQQEEPPGEFDDEEARRRARQALDDACNNLKRLVGVRLSTVK
jgi:hypothetical protein